MTETLRKLPRITTPAISAALEEALAARGTPEEAGRMRALLVELHKAGSPFPVLKRGETT